MQQKHFFLLLGPFVSHVFTYWTVRIQTRPGILSKIVSEYDKKKKHKLQTNPWHREEEPHNNHETLGRHTKQSNKLSLPHQDDCKTRMDIK